VIYWKVEQWSSLGKSTDETSDQTNFIEAMTMPRSVNSLRLITI